MGGNEQIRKTSESEWYEAVIYVVKLQRNMLVQLLASLQDLKEDLFALGDKIIWLNHEHK